LTELKERFAWANCDRLEDADVVLIGVPDESGSHAERKGAARGPDQIRRVSNRMATVIHAGHRSLIQPGTAILTKRIFDHGNVAKEEVTAIVSTVVGLGKKPVVIGGDHSITFEVLKAFTAPGLAVVYFDAHPDFICSEKHYYGSVMCDISSLKGVDLSTSVMMGVRAPEPEELDNLSRSKVRVISPVDILQQGIIGVFEEVQRRIMGHPVYISVDMDVLDPAFAPGVDVPIPGGLTSNELIYLVSRIAPLGTVGFDVMEVSPPNDIQDMTSATAAKLIIETISCM